MAEKVLLNAKPIVGRFHLVARSKSSKGGGKSGYNCFMTLAVMGASYQAFVPEKVYDACSVEASQTAAVEVHYNLSTEKAFCQRGDKRMECDVLGMEVVAIFAPNPGAPPGTPPKV